MAAEPLLGSIHIFGFNYAPRGYLFCSGQQLSIQQNSALFALLGTQYGGNGVQTFAVPDLRGRVPNHFGQSPGTSNYVQGQVGGTEQVTLTQQQLPPHVHAFTGTGTLNAVQTKATEQAPDTGSLLARPTTRNNTDIPQIYVPAGTAGTTVPLGGVNVAGNTGIAGSGLPFSNVQPYLTLSFCIATQGVFPSRN